MDDTNNDDSLVIIEPADDDLKKGSIPLNDADEPDELAPEEDDLLLDPLLSDKKKLFDGVESLDDLAEEEDLDVDGDDDDEW